MRRRIELDFPDWTISYEQGVWYADKALSPTKRHTLVGLNLSDMYSVLSRNTPDYQPRPVHH